MLLTVVVLLAVLVVLAVVGAVAVVVPNVRTLRRQRVIVNLRSGPALTGVLARSWAGRLELTDATLHDTGSPRPLDGVAVAWKANVAFVQVLPPIDPDADGGAP